MSLKLSSHVNTADFEHCRLSVDREGRIIEESAKIREFCVLLIRKWEKYNTTVLIIMLIIKVTCLNVIGLHYYEWFHMYLKTKFMSMYFKFHLKSHRAHGNMSSNHLITFWCSKAIWSIYFYSGSLQSYCWWKNLAQISYMSKLNNLGFSNTLAIKIDKNLNELIINEFNHKAF